MVSVNVCNWLITPKPCETPYLRNHLRPKHMTQAPFPYCSSASMCITLCCTSLLCVMALSKLRTCSCSVAMAIYVLKQYCTSADQMANHFVQDLEPNFFQTARGQGSLSCAISLCVSASEVTVFPPP